jgi:hypothetical protein
MRANAKTEWFSILAQPESSADVRFLILTADSQGGF